MGIFGNLKDKMLSKMMEKKMKDLPKDQQEMFLAAMKRDPQIFKDIAKEIKALTKTGMNETFASIKVMSKYQPKLQKLFMQDQPRQKVVYKKAA